MTWLEKIDPDPDTDSEPDPKSKTESFGFRIQCFEFPRPLAGEKGRGYDVIMIPVSVPVAVYPDISF